jgi:uncharacterized protein (TIGR02757 family)
MIDGPTKRLLRRLAAKYENEDFLKGDPSCFMHQVEGDANREATAFIASCLSFGSRKQFLPKIQRLLDLAGGDVDGWIRGGGFEKNFECGCGDCFYRFFTHRHMHDFLCAYRNLLGEHGTLGEYVKSGVGCDGYAAVDAICRYFASAGSECVVPKNSQSACKRVCMFLRWMVRDGSPVDIGLWSDSIDRRTLVMPLDTHVVQQSVRLGPLHSPATSMNAARRLTAALAEVFPDDPLKGDFALFGYGVNGGR